jgi:hypothetical protein
MKFCPLLFDSDKIQCRRYPNTICCVPVSFVAMCTVNKIHSLGPLMNYYPYFLCCPYDLDIIQETCTQTYAE